MKSLWETVFVGRLLLTGAIYPRLEAFSGNGLYCGRGMGSMKKYKTVKEVCRITGLTRKHLYYFHHTGVVRAVAYANYSVEGNDGYKLYDDAAVEKLQQIALYYQLGLKRDEIRDIMLDPHYDSNLALDTLLSMEQARKTAIEQQIAALEYLKLTGTKNHLLAALGGMSLKELGKTILLSGNGKPCSETLPAEDSPKTQMFLHRFQKLVGALQQLPTAELETRAGEEAIRDILECSKAYFGEMGVAFVLGYFARDIGRGKGSENSITLDHLQGLIRYLTRYPEMKEQLLEIGKQEEGG